jgi:diguanylate cyclase (GGDEF)-like protein/PAS domain S-box-containing protein
MSDTLSLKQLQTIIDVQARVADAALDLEAFMQDVVDAAERLTNATGAVIELIDGDDMVYSRASGRTAAFVGLRLKREGSLSGLCVAERHVLRCDDTETDKRVDREACRTIGVRSMVCTPLYHGGEPVGVLKIMSSEPARFNHYDVQTLRLVAGALGAALGKQLVFDAKNQVETALRESQARLEQSEARLRTLLQDANDAIFSLDADGRLIEWNHAADQMFGLADRGAAGQELPALIMPLHMQEIYRAELKRFLQTGASPMTSKRIELQALNCAGVELQVELSMSAIRVGARWEFLGVLHDISERKNLEQRLQQLALEDSLTGLANRRALLDATERAVSRSKRHGRSFALLYLDLDGFKKINDNYGHAAGDQALKEFSNRIQRVVRGSDMVARLGGDEFAILAEEISTIDDAQTLAQKIVDALDTPMTSPSIKLRTSIGISLYRDNVSAAELFRQADASMYAAKRKTQEMDGRTQTG